MQIMEAIRECISKTMEKLREMNIEPSDIAAIGVTNQRETVIMWDKLTGQPLHNAIGMRLENIPPTFFSSESYLSQ